MSLLKLNTISYVFYFQIIVSGFVGSVFLALGLETALAFLVAAFFEGFFGTI